MDQQMKYLETTYTILSAEQEFIVHPAALGLLPLTNAALQCSYFASFQIKEHLLILEELWIHSTDDLNSKQYLFPERTVPYNGAVLIGADLVKEYSLKNNKIACFSYKNVRELVFEDGILITSVDQSKAMSRIRKNIELGLRSLSNSRDLRCIRRFMNSCLIGDYKPMTFSSSRLKYLKEMRNDYPATGYAKLQKADTMFE